jgi:PhzF family phenazine biosynthesis protein
VAALHVLRVFCDEAGEHGNPLGVFLDGDEVPAERRQAVAHELGFSETVFVDDRRRGECRIFTPGLELPFAGHPTVGTAWLLAHEGEAVEMLRPPAGEVPVRIEGELTFVASARRPRSRRSTARRVAARTKSTSGPGLTRRPESCARAASRSPTGWGRTRPPGRRRSCSLPGSIGR